MLAFEVEIDGERLARAGVDDWAVLSLIVSANRGRKDTGDDDLSLSLRGLTLPDSQGVSHHVRWGGPAVQLAVGGEVRVRIIDSDAVDAPARRYRSDHQVQEPPFSPDEMREMRYRDYLELKSEFEPDTRN